MRFFNAIFIFVSIISFSSSSIIGDVSDCGSTGQINDVIVQGCTSTPCRFARLISSNFRVQFTPAKSSQQVRYILDIHFSSHDLIIRGAELVGEVEGNQMYEAEHSITISENSMFADNLRIEFKILDEMDGNAVVLCGTFPAYYCNHWSC